MHPQSHSPKLPSATPEHVKPEVRKHFMSRFGLLLAAIPLLIVILLPNQPGLPVAGQYMLGILAFAVIVWMTEAVSYPVSAIIIVEYIYSWNGLGQRMLDYEFGLTNRPENAVALTSALILVLLFVLVDTAGRAALRFADPRLNDQE